MEKYLRERYLLTHDLRRIEGLMDILKNNKMIVAGGAITSIFSGAEIRDYDLYFTDVAKKEEVVKWFDMHMSKHFETDRALSYFWINPKKKKERTYDDPKSLNFQLITIPGTEGGTENIFKRFDYTICMGAYRFEDEQFIFHEDFFRHLAQRKLVFNPETLYPINSLIRSKKYMRRGFYMGNVEMLKLALTINALKIDNYKKLKEQLEGIDTLFLKDLTDHLWKNKETDYDFNTAMELLAQHFEEYYADAFEEMDKDEGGEE